MISTKDFCFILKIEEFYKILVQKVSEGPGRSMDGKFRLKQKRNSQYMFYRFFLKFQGNQSLGFSR